MKVVDFGLANDHSKDDTTTTKKKKTRGTLEYSSPEMILPSLFEQDLGERREGEDEDEVEEEAGCGDIWSAGVVGLEMSLGDHPFLPSIQSSSIPTYHQSTIDTPIGGEETKEETHLPLSLPLLRDFYSRVDCVEVLDENENRSSFFQSLCTIHPSLRSSPSQALDHPYITQEDWGTDAVRSIEERKIESPFFSLLFFPQSENTMNKNDDQDSSSSSFDTTLFPHFPPSDDDMNLELGEEEYQGDQSKWNTYFGNVQEEKG